MLWWIQITYGGDLDTLITTGSWLAPTVVMAVVIFLVRVHPEPADACCKCFEDGVAFAGVFIGVKFARWRHPLANHPIFNESVPITVSLLKTAFKILLGTFTFSNLPLTPDYRCLNPARLESFNKATIPSNLAPVLSIARESQAGHATSLLHKSLVRHSRSFANS